MQVLLQLLYSSTRAEASRSVFLTAQSSTFHCLVMACLHNPMSCILWQSVPLWSMREVPSSGTVLIEATVFYAAANALLILFSAIAVLNAFNPTVAIES